MITSFHHYFLNYCQSEHLFKGNLIINSRKKKKHKKCEKITWRSIYFKCWLLTNLLMLLLLLLKRQTTSFVSILMNCMNISKQFDTKKTKKYLDILSRCPNKTPFTRNSCHSMIHLILLIVHSNFSNVIFLFKHFSSFSFFFLIKNFISKVTQFEFDDK